MADTNYTFLSYVRTGFANAITRIDDLGPDQPALAQVTVGVDVEGAGQVEQVVVMHGPGDVLGIAPNQVVRTDPIDGAVGFEPNYFAQIEFDRPDFPWMLTPAAPAGQKLRPWLALVVVDADGANAVELRNTTPLPVLQVPAEAASQLPNLADSVLWAHAQVILDENQSFSTALGRDGDPRRTVSRLLCPRHLEPLRAYLAAVVPAFEVGRLAGVGLDVSPTDEERLAPSWQPGAEVDLPVYYSWRFQTGDGADFESLARKLEGRPLPEGVGTRSMDMSRPGAGLTPFDIPNDTSETESIVWIEGALRPLDAEALPERDPVADQQFRSELTVLLDTPAAQIRSGNEDPVVGPPIYGDKHALVVELGAGTPPPWLTELNLTERNRVAAALGTKVIQERQEDYVARSWRQLGDVLAANRLLRGAQFARSAAAHIHDRLAAMPSAQLLTVASPVHQRVLGIVDPGVTLARSVTACRLPDIAVEPSFRRMVRPSTSIAKAATPRPADPTSPPPAVPRLDASIVSRYSAEAFAAPVEGPDGVMEMREASVVIGAERASEVLSAVGDTQATDPARLDAALATLTASAAAITAGGLVATTPLRDDVGAVNLLVSLGATPAESVLSVLNFATTVEPFVEPSPEPSPSPFVFPIDFTTNVETTTSPVGNSIVIHSVLVRDIISGTTTTTAIDDVAWADAVASWPIPTRDPASQPLTDAGTRLEWFRDDPTALNALAVVVNGDATGFLALDARAGEFVTTGASAATFDTLAAGGAFEPIVPQATAGIQVEGDLEAAQALYDAAVIAAARMVSIDDDPPPPLAPALAVDEIQTGLMQRTDPELTAVARIRARISRAAIMGVTPRDELDPVMASPRFNDPMWQALRDVDSRWLLSGLDLVPPDTVTLAETNPTFVAAQMVGLNHEMMRELLWHGFPTDLRGTPFHRFWGRLREPRDDIRPVHQFDATLVDNLLNGQEGEAVFLIRSELLRRYPGSIIYLARATQDNGDLVLNEEGFELPIFRGTLLPDVTFVGFAITPDSLVVAEDPWWFVIAQPPSEPRFGLDNPSSDTPAVPTTAAELAWSHASSDGDPANAPFAPATLPGSPTGAIDDVRWGDSAAVQARLTYQQPARVAIRAADLMPT